jgi:hypothetical protein
MLQSIRLPASWVMFAAATLSAMLRCCEMTEPIYPVTHLVLLKESGQV